MKKTVLILTFLLLNNIAFAQDLLVLPEVERNEKQPELLVLPKVDIDEKLTEPQKAESKKEELEKKDVKPQEAKDDKKDPLPQGEPSVPKEQPKEEAKKGGGKKTSPQKVMVLKSQKPLPKFYNLLSPRNYRDTILHTLSLLAQEKADIIAFDTDKGFILFETPNNRYLITIFQFNQKLWLKILPMKENFDDDKILNSFMKNFT